LREDAALLVSEGYGLGDVWAMPLAMLWTEADIAQERIHNRVAMESVLIRAAVIDVLSGGNHLRESLEELR
jgi:hypothetical protein